MESEPRRFRLRYTGGTFEIVMMTLLAMLVVFIPLALVNLINGIEIEELTGWDRVRRPSKS